MSQDAGGFPGPPISAGGIRFYHANQNFNQDLPAGGTVDITNLILTILPWGTASIFFIRATVQAGLHFVVSNTGYIRLMRDGIAFALGDASGGKDPQGSQLGYANDGSVAPTMTLEVLDTPVCLKPITYSVQFVCASTGEVNRDQGDNTRLFSSLTIMEFCQG